tara:strand:+ start:1287 stop:1721 length:435 start_codon:yes stop_codon:yes gene_type:complete
MIKPNVIYPFHLAIPVWDLSLSKKFYKDILGCTEGRSDKNWIDMNLFGHQLVLHYKAKENQSYSNKVDGKNVPVPHFGIILEWKVFQKFAKRLKQKKVKFIIEPYIRFEGKAGEQSTMFFLDPCGNAIEFKSFKDFNKIFSKES